MNNALDLKTLADEEVGDAHLMSSVETPMRKDALKGQMFNSFFQL